MKHLIWIVATIAATFAIDRTGGWIFENIKEKSGFRYSRMYFGAEKADVLLVGNSRGLMFYQPAIESHTGLRTFNVSYNGMPMHLADVFCRDYIDLHPPKTMLLDVTICSKRDEELIKDFRCYAPNSARLDSLIRTVDDKVVYGSQFSHLYRYNSEIFQRIFYYRNRSDEDWLLDRVISPSMAQDTAMTKYALGFDSVMVQTLARTVAYAQSKGVDVRLVINPYFPRFGAKVRNSFITPLKNYVEQLTGLPVQDFSNAIAETDEFGDYQHLNKKGGVHYVQVLTQNAILPTPNANQGQSYNGH